MKRLLFRNLNTPMNEAHVRTAMFAEHQASVPHNHDFHEAFLVLAGAGFHHLNRQSFPLQPGQLVLIYPPDTHSFSTDRGLTLSILNIAVSHEWWRAFEFLYGCPPMPDSLTDRLRLLTSESSRQTESFLNRAGREGSAAAVQAWNQILSFWRPKNSPETSPPPWLRAFNDEVHNHPEWLNNEIQFWQRRVGRSPEHFARSCRRYFGVTPSELILRARIERAKYLLQASSDKVISIAFDSGFGSMAHFHRAFLRLTGVTPSAWRGVETPAVPLGSQ